MLFIRFLFKLRFIHKRVFIKLVFYKYTFFFFFNLETFQYTIIYFVRVLIYVLITLHQDTITIIILHCYNCIRF